ncbi:hypothetical protein GQ457_06G000810 [Hibiscus cannabinus]
MKFWTDEWNKHGTCSDFAHDPIKYFDSALKIRKSLPDFGIRSGKSYKVEEVIDLVKGLTGAEPEIACNLNSNNKDVQLWEIRLCYDKPDPQGLGLVHRIRNCPFQLSHYPDGKRKGPCKTDQDVALLNPLLSDLDKEWPNLKNPVRRGNMIFWTDEWNKHGTCSNFAYDPFKYFDSALKIRANLPDFGITSGASYKVEEVINLFEGLTGAKPEIACNLNSNNKDFQLWEIRLCYDKSDPQGQGLVHKIRNCPSKLSHYPGGKSKGPCLTDQDVINVP